MKRLALAIVFFASSAHAERPDAFALMKEKLEKTPATQDSGYFNALGMPGRSWEIRSHTAFGTNRVFAQRFEVAKALALVPRVHFVARASFGLEDDTKTSLYSPQGPIPSAGIRMISTSGNFWFEAGLRLLIPYSGPNDEHPSMLTLARDAVAVSAIADDAAWLPFWRFGTQMYLMVHTRFGACHSDGVSCPVFFGSHYGFISSLGDTAYVASWLGPQHGYIGNAFVELFVTIPNVGWHGSGIQIGGHADVSLSTIWNGSEPFPSSLNGYIAWEPIRWFSARTYLGIGGPLPELGKKNSPTTLPYGVRLVFYVP